LLKHALRSAGDAIAPFVERSVQARLLFVETLLGRKRNANVAKRRLAEVSRTPVEYLETWNDVFLGLASSLRGESSQELFTSAREAFERMQIPYGARLASLGIFVDSERSPSEEVRDRYSGEIAALSPADHRFLRIAESLALAWIDSQRQLNVEAQTHVSTAASQIVGMPFLEIDWLLELLKSQLSYRTGDLGDARRHLHRSLHCRDLLAQYVPSSCRARFLSHSRFDRLEQAKSRMSLQAVTIHSTERLRGRQGFEGLLGRCEAMVEIFRVVERLRDHDVPVLIRGETGTGKDAIARVFHRSGPRAEKPYQVIDCACLPDELFESELFGHTAGAFTDATVTREGLLEEAQGGTVLLSGVDQLSLGAQSKILRVLDTKRFRRLGESSETPLDVRFLATANDKLELELDEGRFRRDLYYRLGNAEVCLPPLRERAEDLPLLVDFFLEEQSRRLDRPVPQIEAPALEALETYSWPGNVRELETTLFRLVLGLSARDLIVRTDVAKLLQREEPRGFSATERLLDRDLSEWREDLEREYLTRLFVELRGDVNAMLDRLEIKSTKLYEWFRALGIDTRELRKKLR
ncbi:MAG: sigma 54-interacting transcriptional regulator, partial [Planctomycetota bacterium]